MSYLQQNGNSDPVLYIKTTLKLFFKKYSVEIAPLWPVEKFSILLTVFYSSGTDVPLIIISTLD